MEMAVEKCPRLNFRLLGSQEIKKDAAQHCVVRGVCKQWGHLFLARATSLYESLCHGVCVSVCVYVCVYVCMYVKKFRRSPILMLVSNKFLARATK